MDDTANLSLPFILPSQAQKHVTHNEALRLLDALVQLAVLDRDLSAPPPIADEGDRYIVAADATGDWEGADGRVAVRQDGGWILLAPRPGWIALVVDENRPVFWSDGGWLDFDGSIEALQELDLLGLGTTADTNNRFAARLNKALWTALPVAEGGNGDLRYTLNKEGAGNVLSFLMQSNWAGRAEIGLVGDDDLSIKVSADGAEWTEALHVDRNTGRAIFPNSGMIADFALNLLPDSGRFAGNAAKSQFAGSYAFPSYLSLQSGTTAASGGKFISDNDDYGGGAGALAAAARDLIDAIREPAYRRYGIEFFIAELTMGSGTTAPLTLEGVTYYQSVNLAFGPRAPAMTFHAYVRALDAPIVWRRFAGQSLVIAGTVQDTHAAIAPDDGWVSVTVHDRQDPRLGVGYNPTPLTINASSSGHRYLLACPALMGGITDIDPSIGIIAAINRWLP